MSLNAQEWLKEKWWGSLVTYLLIAGGTFSLIWAVVEPLGIPETFETINSIFSKRWFYHILASLLIAGHLTLLFDLRLRKSKWNLPGNDSSKLPFNFHALADTKLFYDKIASHYDQRNSTSLLKTHEETVRTIKTAIQRTESVSVLDLGGGTGRLIAHHFFDREDIQWDYVDASSQMADQFRQNLSETALRWHVEINTIQAFLSGPLEKQYDVVLLSLVLSSMDSNPDWSKIHSLLKPNGHLIISDIDSAYTTTHPYYVVPVEAEQYGIEPRSISLTQLIFEAGQAKLKFEDSHPIREGQRNYSFIATFKKIP